MVYRAGGVDYLLISGPIPPVGAVQGGRGRGWGQGGGGRGQSVLSGIPGEEGRPRGRDLGIMVILITHH